MYRLIIGNVRISVENDDISRDQAAAIARRTIADAAQQGKILSHIEITPGTEEPEVRVTERSGGKAAKKTLNQSLLDGIVAAAREKFYPNSAFASRDSWFDVDTGQEWFGGELDTAREEILAKLEAWTKSP